MNEQTTKFDIFQLTPIFILLWSLISFVFFPIMPVANGFGWDGVFYGKVVMDFSNMVGNIDSYHATRIFPAVLFHYIFKLLQIPLCVENALLAYQIYNILIIVLSSVLWVQISKLLKLDTYKKWVGFCILFINYPLLNFHFYYPALTDGTAFFLGMIMLYAYLIKNNILLLLATIIIYFCWPAGIIVGFILFIFSNAEDASFYFKKNKSSVLIFVLILSPLLVLILFNFEGEIKYQYVKWGLDGVYLKKLGQPIIYDKVNITHLINGILNGIYLVMTFWYILRNFDIVKFVITNIKKQFIIKLAISIFIVLILNSIRNIIYSPSISSYTAFDYFTSLFKGINVRFPLQFVFSYAVYWGPVVFLFIIFFKNITLQLNRVKIPFLLIFLYTLIFSINSEGRPIINFYPFIIIVLLQTVDFEKFKNKKIFTTLFVLVSIFYSKVWLIIKLPESTFPQIIIENFDKLPMQLYFMNFGLYINNQMFYLQAIISTIFFLVFYFIIKPLNFKFNSKSKN